MARGPRLVEAPVAGSEHNLRPCGVLERVAAECRLAGAPGLVAVRRFFYDAYSRCVEGSIFDGLRMDLVSFAEELLVGGSLDEQRIGVGILVNVASSPRLGDAALRRVGTSPAVVERLVEMISWTGDAERGARAAAALVVSKLASKKRNALRVAGVPGAIESVPGAIDALLRREQEGDKKRSGRCGEG